LRLIEPFFEMDFQNIAVHGDCHWGNILWDREGPNLVDFDDMLLAPPVQDVWMLFNGTREEVHAQREAFFKGYETFREFDHDSLILTEPLRTLRMIRHAAWIGKRYDEAVFQHAFPYYPETRYWEEFLLSIKEQVSLLQEAQDDI
jgi:Ser/Thr protein kinase RdoA (MazF antagonist)